MGQIVLAVFAALMLVGGFMGARAGSKASLRAGATSAVVLFLTLLISRDNPLAGYATGAVVAVVLAAVFGKRLAATGKAMPSGMLLGVCLLAAGLLGWAAFKAG